MTVEFAGTVIASFLGSWHCAGMCGPFGMFLANSKNKHLSQVMYHLGRLVTYLCLSAVLHLFGNSLRFLKTEWLFIVLLLIWVVLLFSEVNITKIVLPKWIVMINQRFMKSQSVLAGFLLGATTTLLPCIWLYGFLILSSAQASLPRSLLVIFAFWLGTLPALVGAHNFIFKASSLLRNNSRRLSAVLLLILGLVSWGSHWPHATSGEPESCSLHMPRPGHNH